MLSLGVVQRVNFLACAFRASNISYTQVFFVLKMAYRSRLSPLLVIAAVLLCRVIAEKATVTSGHSVGSLSPVEIEEQLQVSLARA